jgi:hypothetical protein
MGMEACVWVLIGVMGIIFAPAIWEEKTPSLRGLGSHSFVKPFSRQDDARLVGFLFGAE